MLGKMIKANPINVGESSSLLTISSFAATLDGSYIVIIWLSLL